MLYFPATQRNREPIWEVLEPHAKGTVLEIASGSGEHLAFFASKSPQVTWIPSDPEPAHRASIAAWTGLEPLDFAVGGPVPEVQVDGVLAINLIHIAPWEVTVQLMAAVGQLLNPRGFLYMYGAYRRGGKHTSPSNDAFDRSLRSQDARWGVRNLEDVVAEAEKAGLALEEVVQMPANNLSIIYRQGG